MLEVRLVVAVVVSVRGTIGSSNRVAVSVRGVVVSVRSMVGSSIE